MLRPTFSGFQVARRGINTSQKLLDVTGQNISNINTIGYTRQRVDLNSIPESGGSRKYAGGVAGIGRGVMDMGPSQVRDKFLDIRYREQASKVGKDDVLQNALNDLENVFDEMTTEGLDAKVSYLKSQLQSLSQTPSNEVIEGVVKTAATMVTHLFNDYSKQIEKIASQQREYLQEDAVPAVNNLLKNIAELNDQIKRQNIQNDPALELNDRRNMLIDELSTYMNIKVERTSVDIGNGKTVEELNIKNMDIDDGSGNNLYLIKNNEHAELGVDFTDKENIKLNLTKSIDTNFDIVADPSKADITDDTNVGKLAGYLKFNNNKAEFIAGSNVDVKDRGYQYYRGMIDSIANKFASEFNKLNCSDTNGDGVIDPNLSGVADPSKDDPKFLFEADGGGKITAANIKISDAWRDTNESYVINSTVTSEGNDNSAANDNILKMIALFDKKLSFDSVGDGSGNHLFDGTLQQCLSHTTTTLALQINNTKSSFTNYLETLTQIDKMRSSISGVSLDEEGINLLTYNKSYSAASRLMTTLDQALDTLINRTGRVGL